MTNDESEGGRRTKRSFGNEGKKAQFGSSHVSSMREIKSKAVLYAFDKAGLVVYSQILDLGAYYDGEHIWDSWERIKTAGIVRLVGTLFDPDGNLSQEFENTYDEATGSLLGSKAFHAREHLKTDERQQKMLDALARLREQKPICEALEP